MNGSGLMVLAVVGLSLWRLDTALGMAWGWWGIVPILLGRFLPVPAPAPRYYPCLVLLVWLSLGSLLYWASKYPMQGAVDIFWLGWAGVLVGAIWRRGTRRHPHQQVLGFTDDELHDRLIRSASLWGSGLFVLSTVDFGDYNQWRNLLAVSLGTLGILEYTGWRVALNETNRTLYLAFAGMWGLQSQYHIRLQPYNRLESVKMAEVADMVWLTLSGTGRELALPLSLDLSPQMEDLLRSRCRLAKHQSDRESLALIGILLPQGASILAGLVLMLLGITLNWALTSDLPQWLAVFLLLAIVLCSPCGARLLLSLIAPAHLSPEPLARSFFLLPWEWGLVLGTSLFFISYHQYLESLISLGLTWLAISLSFCLLALVRRTPILWNQSTD